MGVLGERSKALAEGVPMYTTDQPCKRGHLAPRYTTSGNCAVCLSEDGRRRYEPAVAVAKAREWKRQNPHKRREYKLRGYGLTPASFAAMLDEQAGACKVCRTVLRGGQQTHVDHCHSTGIVRGILCAKCNMAIGLLADSPERAEAMAKYLRGFL